jgi:erythromycin esterase
MSLQDEILEIGKAFSEVSDFSELIDKIKDKKIVMLGESSHGTQEFYEWRRLLSNELISKHGFNFIAVEGDWPPCERINQYIHNDNSERAEQVMTRFSRWPTWMWGNTEVSDLMDDLREINNKSKEEVGFHGLDVYSLYESLEETVMKLRRIDPMLSDKVNELYSCFEPFRHDERAYAHSLFRMPKGCEEEVVSALSLILQRNLDYDHRYFDVIQNARIIKNAERYYRAMISFDDGSWNVRDRHMLETLDNLLEHYGSKSKGIVWAHNTHIGDYRATSMVTHGQINLGGLAREKYGEEEVALIGFTTFTGKVIASHAWDGPIQVMSVPDAIEGSLEFSLHQAIPKLHEQNFYLDFSLVNENSDFLKVIGHRAIGVVYHPEHEHRGNYVPTIPAKRYDALVFFNETQALTPLDVKFKKEKIPETYPFGDQI